MTLLDAPAAAPARVPARALHGAEALAALDRLGPLWERTGAPVTARADWLRAAAAADPSWTPLLVLVERAGVPVAAAPLAERRRAGVRTVRGLDLGHADAARLPADDEAAARALARGVVAALRTGGPWRLELDQLPGDDPVVALLARVLPLRVEAATGCPLATPDPDLPLPGQLTVNGRKSLRAGRNRLARDGHELAATWVRDVEALAALPGLQALRRERDHAAGRASDLDVPAYTRFHTDLCRRLAAAGALELLRLTVDGELATYELCVRDGDVLRVFDGRVAPGYERYGTGWLSNVELLERVHRDPALRALDLMRGEQETKTRLGAVVVPAVRVRAVSAPWVDRADAVVERLAARAEDVARRLVPPQRRHAVRALLRG